VVDLETVSTPLNGEIPALGEISAVSAGEISAVSAGEISL
jgi:hypothetical protein